MQAKKNNDSKTNGTPIHKTVINTHNNNIFIIPDPVVLAWTPNRA
jgi:hypothetical protein